VLLTVVRKILAFEMTVAEWIGTAIMLAVPYLVVGVGWTALTVRQWPALNLDQLVATAASIVFWPVLLVSTVCLT